MIIRTIPSLARAVREGLCAGRFWRGVGLAAAAALLMAARAPPIWGMLEPGPNRVSVEARQLDSPGLRAVVWRPAAPSERLTVGDLSSLICGGEGVSDPVAACLADVADNLRRASGNPPSASTLQTLADADLYAGAAVGGGDRRAYPLILLEGSVSGRGSDFMILAEYLASWGYVVATVAEGGPASRTYDAARARQRAEALAATIRALSSTRFVDARRIGLVAWSFGGVVIPLVARDDARVRALVSLDAANNYAYGAEIMRRTGTGQAGVPLLNLLPGVSNDVAKDDSFVRLSRLVREAVVPGLAHGGFSDLYGPMTAFLIGGDLRRDFSPAHAAAVQAIRSFLDAYVKQDRRAQRRLETGTAFEGLVSRAAAPSP